MAFCSAFVGGYGSAYAGALSSDSPKKPRTAALERLDPLLYIRQPDQLILDLPPRRGQPIAFVSDPLHLDEDCLLGSVGSNPGHHGRHAVLRAVAGSFERFHRPPPLPKR